MDFYLCVMGAPFFAGLRMSDGGRSLVTEYGNELDRR